MSQQVHPQHRVLSPISNNVFGVGGDGHQHCASPRPLPAGAVATPTGDPVPAPLHHNSGGTAFPVAASVASSVLSAASSAGRPWSAVGRGSGATVAGNGGRILFAPNSNPAGMSFARSSAASGSAFAASRPATAFAGNLPSSPDFSMPPRTNHSRQQQQMLAPFSPVSGTASPTPEFAAVVPVAGPASPYLGTPSGAFPDVRSTPVTQQHHGGSDERQARQDKSMSPPGAPTYDTVPRGMYRDVNGALLGDAGVFEVSPDGPSPDADAYASPSARVARTAQKLRRSEERGRDAAAVEFDDGRPITAAPSAGMSSFVSQRGGAVAPSDMPHRHRGAAAQLDMSGSDDSDASPNANADAPASASYMGHSGASVMLLDEGERTPNVAHSDGPSPATRVGGRSVLRPVRRSADGSPPAALPVFSAPAAATQSTERDVSTTSLSNHLHGLALRSASRPAELPPRAPVYNAGGGAAPSASQSMLVHHGMAQRETSVDLDGPNRVSSYSPDEVHTRGAHRGRAPSVGGSDAAAPASGRSTAAGDVWGLNGRGRDRTMRSADWTESAGHGTPSVHGPDAARRIASQTNTASLASGRSCVAAAHLRHTEVDSPDVVSTPAAATIMSFSHNGMSSRGNPPSPLVALQHDAALHVMPDSPARNSDRPAHPHMQASRTTPVVSLAALDTPSAGNSNDQPPESGASPHHPHRGGAHRADRAFQDGFERAIAERDSMPQPSPPPPLAPAVDPCGGSVNFNASRMLVPPRSTSPGLRVSHRPPTRGSDNLSNACGGRYFKEYRELRALGSGHTGVVSLCRHILTGQHCAIKRIRNINSREEEKRRGQEMLVLKLLVGSSPHVIQLQGEWSESVGNSGLGVGGGNSPQAVGRAHSFMKRRSVSHSVGDFAMMFGGGERASRTQLYLQLPFCPFGDLAHIASSRRHTNRRWSEAEVLLVLAHMALALHAVHSIGAAHRDLKPDNIVIDASLRFVLTDFGCAVRHAPQPPAVPTAGVPAGSPLMRLPAASPSNVGVWTSQHSEQVLGARSRGCMQHQSTYSLSPCSSMPVLPHSQPSMPAVAPAAAGGDAGVHAKSKPTDFTDMARSVFFGNESQSQFPAARGGDDASQVGDQDIGDGRYQPRDMLNNTPYVQAGDIFALGMTLYELLSGTAAPAGGPEHEDLRTRSSMPEIVRWGYSRELADVVCRMMAQDAWRRPTAIELLGLPMLRPGYCGATAATPAGAGARFTEAIDTAARGLMIAAPSASGDASNMGERMPTDGTLCSQQHAGGAFRYGAAGVPAATPSAAGTVSGILPPGHPNRPPSLDPFSLGLGQDLRRTAGGHVPGTPLCPSALFHHVAPQEEDPRVVERELLVRLLADREEEHAAEAELGLNDAPAMELQVTQVVDGDVDDATDAAEAAAGPTGGFLQTQDSAIFSHGHATPMTPQVCGHSFPSGRSESDISPPAVGATPVPDAARRVNARGGVTSNCVPSHVDPSAADLMTPVAAPVGPRVDLPPEMTTKDILGRYVPQDAAVLGWRMLMEDDSGADDDSNVDVNVTPYDGASLSVARPPAATAAVRRLLLAAQCEVAAVLLAADTAQRAAQPTALARHQTLLRKLCAAHSNLRPRGAAGNADGGNAGAAASCVRPLRRADSNVSFVRALGGRPDAMPPPTPQRDAPRRPNGGLGGGGARLFEPSVSSSVMSAMPAGDVRLSYSYQDYGPQSQDFHSLLQHGPVSTPTAVQPPTMTPAAALAAAAAAALCQQRTQQATQQVMGRAATAAYDGSGGIVSDSDDSSDAAPRAAAANGSGVPAPGRVGAAFATGRTGNGGGTFAAPLPVSEATQLGAPSGTLGHHAGLRQPAWEAPSPVVRPPGPHTQSSHASGGSAALIAPAPRTVLHGGYPTGSFVSAGVARSGIATIGRSDSVSSMGMAQRGLFASTESSMRGASQADRRM